jgi:5-formyltetrahydrofolate cyclo-ligase
MNQGPFDAEKREMRRYIRAALARMSPEEQLQRSMSAQNRLADMVNFRMSISPPGTSYYPVEVETLKALGVYEKAQKNMRPIEPSRTAEAVSTGFKG